MQDKSKFDELLISYLSKELNEEDEAFVLEWIKFNEENRSYFEELHKLWQLLEAEHAVEGIDVNFEWKQFKQEINSKQQKAFFLQEVEKIAIDKQHSRKPGKKAVLYALISTVVAASAVLAISLTTDLFIKKIHDKPSVARASKEKTNKVLAVLTHQVNNSGKPRRLLLKDGSTIILSDKSELSYQEPFTGNRRGITLKGGASFAVAEDKTRPFTVFSGDISTTVLGTVFTVTAFENTRDIIVRLYDGKVVVKPVARLLTKAMKDFFLLPGQELIYNNFSSTAKLRKFKVDNTAAVNKPARIGQEPDMPSIPFHEEGSWYMFNNQSLVQVFKELEMMYDVKIVYPKSAVRNKYFIGTFQKTDSVETVLKKMALPNDFKVEKKNNTFIISKYRH